MTDVDAIRKNFQYMVREMELDIENRESEMERLSGGIDALRDALRNAQNVTRALEDKPDPQPTEPTAEGALRAFLDAKEDEVFSESVLARALPKTICDWHETISPVSRHLGSRLESALERLEAYLAQFDPPEEA